LKEIRVVQHLGKAGCSAALRMIGGFLKALEVQQS
jgi:hypothetical protein